MHRGGESRAEGRDEGAAARDAGDGDDEVGTKEAHGGGKHFGR